jgi:hypothetical protein
VATSLIESMNQNVGKESSPIRKQRDEASLRKVLYMENNEKIKFAGNIELYSKRLLKDIKNNSDPESKVQCEIGVKLKKKAIQLLADIAGVPYGDKKKFQRSQLEMQVKKNNMDSDNDYDSDDIDSDHE